MFRQSLLSRLLQQSLRRFLPLLLPQHHLLYPELREGPGLQPLLRVLLPKQFLQLLLLSKNRSRHQRSHYPLLLHLYRFLLPEQFLRLLLRLSLH